jgi:COX assembly protein 2
MHPPLEPYKHEGCDKVIEALEECHRAGTFNKFIGTCNAAKIAVDKCLKEEVQCFFC